jgi:hypothetical protein
MVIATQYEMWEPLPSLKKVLPNLNPVSSSSKETRDHEEAGKGDSESSKRKSSKDRSRQPRSNFPEAVVLLRETGSSGSSPREIEINITKPLAEKVKVSTVVCS